MNNQGSFTEVEKGAKGYEKRHVGKEKEEERAMKDNIKWKRI